MSVPISYLITGVKKVILLREREMTKCVNDSNATFTKLSHGAIIKYVNGGSQ